MVEIGDFFNFFLVPKYTESVTIKGYFYGDNAIRRRIIWMHCNNEF